LPDALIPFAGSRHRQRTSISLDEGAMLFWWEILAPGRLAMGERFAFDRLLVESEIRSPTRPLLMERYLFEPALRPLASTARLGAYSYLANFYACQIGRPAPCWRELEQVLSGAATAQTQPRVTIWGSSTLASDGVVVRGLSASARDLPAMLAGFWSIARHFLTGERAVPPRKIN